MGPHSDDRIDEQGSDISWRCLAAQSNFLATSGRGRNPGRARRSIPANLSPFGETGVFFVVVADMFSVDAIQHRAAITALIGAHLEPLYIADFLATIGSPAVQTPQVVGSLFLDKNLVPMITIVVGSGYFHHLAIYISVPCLGFISFLEIFHVSSGFYFFHYHYNVQLYRIFVPPVIYLMPLRVLVSRFWRL
jgi:hypothetical protein